MAKKIKARKPLTKEEREAERLEKDAAAARAAAGIEDEFQAKGFELAEWAQTNAKLVMAAIGLIALSGLLTFVYQNYSTERDQEASRLFAEAHEAFNANLGDAPGILTGASDDAPSFKDANERATKSRDLFREVTSKYSSSGAASLAWLYVGHTSLTLEEYDAAAEAYGAFLEANSRDDSLRFLALDGLSIAAEASGKQEAAISHLEELIGLPGKVGEDTALFRVAKLYKASGDVAKARAAAERLVNDHETSAIKVEAEALLESLQAAAAPATAGG